MMKLFAKIFLENNTPVAEHTKKLESNGAQLVERFTRLGDSDSSRRTLRHIVAIERWGTNRLRILLGEKPFERDDSNAYKPAQDASWPELLEVLKTTRADLVALAPRLEGKTNKVAHNAMGELSGRAWLKYLETHATLESKRVRVKN
jgi:hypothetical protein